MNNQNFESKSNIQNRELRVFVSSTFDDMKEERQYLIDTVFPSIKQLCQKRGVDFIPIDLRWGITKKQAESGQVVEVCLKSVKECNVFIGLLGERYGSKPNLRDLKKNPKMKSEFPFLEDDIKNQLSMTEIEMQYGVLRDPQHRISCFCFRSKIMQLEFEKSKSPIEESSEDKKKLERLKEEIKSKKNRDSVCINEYDSVEEMGALVESFLKTNIINKLFPAETTWYDRQMAQQDFFIELKQKLYVSRDEDYKRINDFMDSPSQYFAITGERGNGKSSLVANWMGTRPDLKFIYCFVGASENSYNPADILKLLIAQLNPDVIKYDEADWEIMLELESENKPKGKEDQPERNSWYDKYHAIFKRALNEWHNTNPDERIVLILDGINQILDYQNSKELQWVPKLPKHVKAIFTTWEDDRTNVSLRAFGAETMNVEPLNAKQIREIIDRFLDDRGRSLPDSQLDRIVDDKESQSPIVLRTLLEELCYFGNYKKLGSHIRSYVKTDTKIAFFERVLKRLEDSFITSKVSRMLISLSASRAGLSNEELLEVANSQTKPPRCRRIADKINSWWKSESDECTLFNWKQICYSLDNHFIERGGRNYFSHDLIASAAEKRYEVHIPKVRNLIVKCLKNNADLERQCEEIPWQLSKLEKWSELNKFFLNPDVLKCMSNKSDFSQYLSNLYDHEKNLNKFFEQDLSKLNPDDRVKIYRALAAFGASINDFHISERGLTEALNVLRKNRDGFEDKERYESRLATTLYNLGTIHHYSDRKQAECEYSEALEISRSLYPEKPEEYAGIINDLGLLYLEMRRFDQSEGKFSEALDIYGSYIKDHPDERESRYFYTLPLLNRALLNMERAYFSEAKADFLDCLERLQELNKENPGFCDDDIAKTLMNLGYLFFNMYCNSQVEEYIAESDDFLKKALDAYRQLEQENLGTFKRELGLTHLNRGNVYMHTGRTDEAINEFSDALRYFQEQDKELPGSCDDNIAKTLMNLGSLYLNVYRDSQDEKNLTESDAFLTSALEAFRYLDREIPGAFKLQITKVLTEISEVHLNEKQEILAKDELNEALSICRSMTESEESLVFVAGGLYSLAQIYKEGLHDYSRCKELLLESQTAFEKLNELHPGEYEDALNDIKDRLMRLEEDENGSSNKE